MRESSWVSRPTSRSTFPAAWRTQPLATAWWQLWPSMAWREPLSSTPHPCPRLPVPVKMAGSSNSHSGRTVSRYLWLLFATTTSFCPFPHPGPGNLLHSKISKLSLPCSLLSSFPEHPFTPQRKLLFKVSFCFYVWLQNILMYFFKFIY